jgi:hypothetical protein
LANFLKQDMGKFSQLQVVTAEVVETARENLVIEIN